MFGTIQNEKKNVVEAKKGRRLYKKDYELNISLNFQRVSRYKRIWFLNRKDVALIA